MQVKNTKRIATGVLVAGIAIAACWSYWAVAKKQSAERAREVVVATAPLQIGRTFKAWSTSTEEKGVIVQWRGDKSELLWVQHVPANERESRFGGRVDTPEYWLLWAKTPNGRYFTLTYFLRNDLTFYVEKSPETVQQVDLIRALVGNGEVDLATKLGLPVKES